MYTPASSGPRPSAMRPESSRAFRVATTAICAARAMKSRSALLIRSPGSKSMEASSTSVPSSGTPDCTKRMADSPRQILSKTFAGPSP